MGEGPRIEQMSSKLAAAALAGVVLTKPELEVASKVVRAEIINHPQDRAADDTAAEGRKKAGGGGGCTVQ